MEISDEIQEAAVYQRRARDCALYRFHFSIFSLLWPILGRTGLSCMGWSTLAFWMWIRVRIETNWWRFVCRLLFCQWVVLSWWQGVCVWQWCCRYMLEVLPLTDWSQTAARPALNLILRRLERMFSKIYKKSTLRVCASILLRHRPTGEK